MEKTSGINNEDRAQMKQSCLEAQAAILELFDALDEDRELAVIAITYQKAISPMNFLGNELRFRAANALLTGRY
jgi:hypothetical protein